MEPTLLSDLLDEVCQSRETRSAVTLAGALVDRGRLLREGDPVGLVTTIIEDLGNAGLVTYNLRREWSTIPLHIRATPLGYARAGYERETKEVGSRAAKRGAPLQKGPTDFRSLPNATWGGPIERESLTDHLDHYPDHRSIHPSPWECGPYVRSMDMARPKVDHSARVAATMFEVGEPVSWSELNDALGGVQSSTHRMIHQAVDAGYIRRTDEGWRLTDAGRRIATESDDDKAEPAPASTRDAIINALQVYGEIDSPAELLAKIAFMDPRFGRLGIHSLDHQLHSMQKAGLISFRVTRNGNAQSITRIQLVRAKERDAMPVEVAPKPEDPHFARVERLANPEPMPVDQIDALHDDGYPILTSLRERAIQQEATSRRADAYLSAASALDGVDQAESERLMTLADSIASSVAMSAVESEYLRYANDKDEDDGHA